MSLMTGPSEQEPGWDPGAALVGLQQASKGERSFRICAKRSRCPRLQAHGSRLVPAPQRTRRQVHDGLHHRPKPTLINLVVMWLSGSLEGGLTTRSDADSTLIAGIGKRVALDLARVVSPPHW